MFEIKGEKNGRVETWTEENEENAVNLAWTMWIEKWYYKITVYNKKTGEKIYRKA